MLPQLAHPRRSATLKELPHDERQIVLSSMLLYALSSPGLLTRGVDRWGSTLDDLARQLELTRLHDDPAQATMALARLTATAARHVRPEPSPLHQALVLSSLLKAHGHAPVLHYGVRRLGNRLEAHAWVEHAGIWIDPAEEGGFGPLAASGPDTRQRSARTA